MFTKNDLKNGDVVTLRNGDKLLFIDDDFRDFSDDNYNNLGDVYDLNDNLTMEDRNDKDNDIVKVERPITYEVKFECVKREMTIAEIEEELGYGVKIVKEAK